MGGVVCGGEYEEGERVRGVREEGGGARGAGIWVVFRGGEDGGVGGVGG